MRSSPQCAAGRSAHAQFAIVRSRVCGGASRPSRLHCLFLLSAVTIFGHPVNNILCQITSNRVKSLQICHRFKSL